MHKAQGEIYNWFVILQLKNHIQGISAAGCKFMQPDLPNILSNVCIRLEFIMLQNLLIMFSGISSFLPIIVQKYYYAHIFMHVNPILKT